MATARLIRSYALEECWLPVVGFEDKYEVSDRGRMRGVAREVLVPSRWGPPFRKMVPGRIIKGSKGKDGHLMVAMGYDGYRKPYYIHRLILEAFVGPAPKGKECRHLDGNPTNNVLSNLCWGTRQQNIDDQRRHRGRPGIRLDVEDIRLMRRRFKEGKPMKEIAKEFGVSLSVPYNIRAGRLHADVM